MTQELWSEEKAGLETGVAQLLATPWPLMGTDPGRGADGGSLFALAQEGRAKHADLLVTRYLLFLFSCKIFLLSLLLSFLE